MNNSAQISLNLREKNRKSVKKSLYFQNLIISRKKMQVFPLKIHHRTYLLDVNRLPMDEIFIRHFQQHNSTFIYDAFLTKEKNKTH